MTWSMLSDFRYGARAVWARPRLAVVVMLTLALGIGVNVAIFSLFQQVLLRPLPVPEPDRLVNLTDPGPKRVEMTTSRLPGERPSASGGSDTVFSYPMFRDLEREQEPFVGLAAHRFFEFSIGEQPQLETGALVSGSYFSVLGLRPAVGRLLGPADDRVDGQAESVVLSHAYWHSEFGGDPDVLGRTLIVKGVPLTIVGVAPRGFHGTAVNARPNVFVPITIYFPDDELYPDLRPFVLPNHDSRNQYWLHLFARLKPGVTQERAASAINALYRAILNDTEMPLLTTIDEQQREAFRTRTIALQSGRRGQTWSETLSPARTTLKLLLAVSGLLLLLCCANIAGLMHLRAMARTREMAVRASIGATHGRVASLILAESLVLALPGGLLSLPVAWLTLRGASLVPGISVAAPDASLSAAAPLLAIGIAVASALATGLVPVWGMTRTEPGKILQAYGTSHTAAKGVTHFRTALATTQVALSMMLLAIAFLFAQSLANTARINLGIDIDSVVMFSVPAQNGFATHGTSLAPIIQALNAVPGVSTVTWSEHALLSQPTTMVGRATVEGMDVESLPVSNDIVSPDFFRTFGVALLAGREFNNTDLPLQKAIVNQRFAAHFDLSPPDIIGRRVRLGVSTIEIVGVVADVRFGKVTEIKPQMFMRVSDRATIADSVTFYVHSARPPGDLMNVIRETVGRVDQAIAITDLRTMEQQVRESTATERFVAGASTTFAVLATALAALGLYGLFAHSVAQRSREIALRVALGASARRIGGMILRQVAGMAVVGILLGAIAAWILGRAARSLLFGIGPGDPLALVAATTILAAVTLCAGYIPARRASRTDPMTVMRYE